MVENIAEVNDDERDHGGGRWGDGVRYLLFNPTEMEKIKIAIPSKKRADTMISHKLFKDFDVHIFVHTEEEAEEYKKIHDKIIITKALGMPHQRNFILNYFSKGDKIVIADDDLPAVERLEADGKNLRKIKSEEIKKLIEKGFELCDSFGTKMWGVAPVRNPFYMGRKISFKSFLTGAFFGVEISDIRCDENLFLKSDYDFAIQHILRYGRIIRFDGYTVDAGYCKNTGGCTEIREAAGGIFKKRACEYLIKKYPKIVRYNPKRKDEILLKFKEQ